MTLQLFNQPAIVPFVYAQMHMYQPETSAPLPAFRYELITTEKSLQTNNLATYSDWLPSNRLVPTTTTTTTTTTKKNPPGNS